MIFNILNTIILLGAIQGLIFSFLLFSSQEGKIADKLLAVILILMSLAASNIYLSESYPIWQIDVFLSIVPTMLIMPIGPLIYFYVQLTLGDPMDWRKHYNFHFLPVCIDLFPIMCAWCLSIGYLSDSFAQDDLLKWGSTIDRYNTLADIPRWISITIYLLLSKKLCQEKKDRGTIEIRPIKTAFLDWLQVFIHIFLLFQAVWLLFLVFYIDPSTRFILLDTVGYYPLYIPLTFLIYILGIKGYLISRGRPGKSLKKGQSIQLSEEKTICLLERIEHAMVTEKLFLDPSFNLEGLVNYLDSDQRTISHILNKNLDKNFKAFINHYRIEEVKRMMADPSFQHMNISGLAFEAGFNSVSTFHRTFKQLTGQTPREYLSSQLSGQEESYRRGFI